MKQSWSCPDCGATGDAEILSRPAVGEVLSVITSVVNDHRMRSPGCQVTLRPGGYVRLILYIFEPIKEPGPADV